MARGKGRGAKGKGKGAKGKVKGEGKVKGGRETGKKAKNALKKLEVDLFRAPKRPIILLKS